MPIIKPNNEKLSDVNNRKVNIQKGCFMEKVTNNVAVINIIRPINTDFVVAAPT